jgi:hypothetical protein
MHSYARRHQVQRKGVVRAAEVQALLVDEVVIDVQPHASSSVSMQMFMDIISMNSHSAFCNSVFFFFFFFLSDLVGRKEITVPANYWIRTEFVADASVTTVTKARLHVTHCP